MSFRITLSGVLCIVLAGVVIWLGTTNLYLQREVVQLQEENERLKKADANTLISNMMGMWAQGMDDGDLGEILAGGNPTVQLAEARNAQRRADANVILNAVWQYAIDNNGNLPAGIPTGEPGVACARRCDDVTEGKTVDLSVLLDMYVVQLPMDPASTDEAYVGYTIVRDSVTNRIVVAAPAAENGATITVTR